MMKFFLNSSLNPKRKFKQISQNSKIKTIRSKFRVSQALNSMVEYQCLGFKNEFELESLKKICTKIEWFKPLA